MTEVKFTDDDIRKLYNKGMNDRQIAEELESRQWIICERRNKLGLKPNRNRKYMRKFTDQQLIELHSFGLSDEEIGKKAGVTGPAIGVRRRNLNLQPNQKKYRKFTDEQLKEDIERGLTDTEIAEKYGCSNATVSWHKGRILMSRKTRKELLDSEFLEIYNSGKFNNDRELALYFGVCKRTIMCRRIKLKLDSLRSKIKEKKIKERNEKKNKIEEEKMLEKKMIVELYNKGLTDIEISNIIGCSPAKIFTKRKELDLPRIKKYQTKKEDMTTIQVSHSTMKELKKLGSKGESYFSIIERLIDLED